MKGAEVRKLREDLQLNQTDFAAKFRLGRTYISSLENDVVEIGPHYEMMFQMLSIRAAVEHKNAKLILPSARKLIDSYKRIADIEAFMS